MYPIYFDAVLKAEGGKISEPGEACVSREENKITFKSDFVPLIKLDETVQIIRVLGEKQFETFAGQVYLSSRNLLQITSVEQTILEQARRLFAINAHIPVTLLVSPDRTAHFNIKKAEQISGTIRFVSRDIIKISAMQYVGEGHYLYLNAEQPVSLKKTLVRVDERILLSKRAAISICKIISQPQHEKDQLQKYMDTLRQEPPDESQD